MAARWRNRLSAALLVVILALSTVGVALVGRAASAATPPVADSVEVGSPAVVSSSPGRTDVFTRSDRGTLVYQYRPSGGSWTATRDLGGTIASQPGVVSWAPGRFDVFARGTGGTLLHRWFTTPGGWSAWEDLGGTVRSAPSAVTWGLGRLHVFVRAADDALWYRSYAAGSGWSAWQRVGGILTASPAVTAWEPGRLDVFVRATDGSLRHTYSAGTCSAGTCSTGTWTPFENLGGVLSSQPAAASVGVGRIDVPVRATDTSMRVKTYVSGSGWSGFVNRGGSFTSGPGAGAASGDLLVAGRAPRGIYLDRRSAATGWGARPLIDVYQPVRHLATWVDTLDYSSLDPVSSVDRMRSLGVRTLYLSTARFNSASDFYDAPTAARWLDAAHAAGISVVGWYVPGYGDMARDVSRTVAIATYVSPGGQRFDAVGVDIERFGTDGEVPLATFNTRLVDHLQQVRTASAALLVAIVPPPYATMSSSEVPQPRWQGFPWASVGARSDVVEPMTFWTNRSNYSADRVYSWVRDQIAQTASLTGRPVAVEGGVGSDTSGSTPATLDRLNRFIDAVRDGHAVGGSHYDYLATTGSGFWSALARLNTF